MQQNGYAALLELRGNLHFERVESKNLLPNGLGDCGVKPLIVYTPPGYDATGSRTYPVIYILHGYSGNALKLLAGGAWERNVVQWADQCIVAGAMQPCLIALVDGWTRLGGSQYVDSIQNGAYANYVTRDVVEKMDASYRTIAREGGRAVAGKSSGGFGALHLVLAHPGIFAAFASHSGDAYFRSAFPPAFADAQRTLERYKFDIAAFVAAFEQKPKRSQAEFETMMTIALAAAYSPRSSEPFDVELPFDRNTGMIREEVFARWRAFDPVERVPEQAVELKRLRLRYLDCGRRDEYGLDIGTRIVAAHMRALGLPVRHEEFDDDHRNVGYRYAVSLPALAEVLDEGS